MIGDDDMSKAKQYLRSSDAVGCLVGVPEDSPMPSTSKYIGNSTLFVSHPRQHIFFELPIRASITPKDPRSHKPSICWSLLNRGTSAKVSKLAPCSPCIPQMAMPWVVLGDSLGNRKLNPRPTSLRVRNFTPGCQELFGNVF